MKDAGTKPNIPVPPVTNVGIGPSHTQQQGPLEDSEEQTESQQNDSNQGGEGETDEEEGQDLVKNTPDPNRQDKHKTPEVEEVNKMQPWKKVKASKDKNIDDTPGLTSEELDEALSKSTEVLTKKWLEFVALHLDAISGVAQHLSELKDLAAQSVTDTVASSTLVNAQPDLRQWLA